MIKNRYDIKIDSFPPYPKKIWEEILVLFLGLLETHKNFSFKNCTLTLLVVKDNDMIFYNKEQMNAYGPTNILSFPENDIKTVFVGKVQPAIMKKRSCLGTLILSIDTLLREAYLYGQNPQTHAIRLLAHGLVHLLGYDHGKEMWELTDFLEDNFSQQEYSHTIIPFWSFTHG